MSPGLNSASLDLPSGDVKRSLQGVYAVSTDAGCECIATFPPGLMVISNARTSALSIATLYISGASFTGSCARATSGSAANPIARHVRTRHKLAFLICVPPSYFGESLLGDDTANRPRA